MRISGLIPHTLYCTIARAFLHPCSTFNSAIHPNPNHIPPMSQRLRTGIIIISCCEGSRGWFARASRAHMFWGEGAPGTQGRIFN